MQRFAASVLYWLFDSGMSLFTGLVGLNAKVMSPQKAVNAFKVASSYIYSRVSGDIRHWGMPIGVSIEPTTACNLGCPECPSGLKQFTRPTGNLKKDFFERMLDELGPKLSYLTFYFQGEPYINPNFLDMVELAGKRGIFTSTSTNAHFLSEENAKRTVESGLDRIIISIDGTTQETYESYRKEGSLEKVLDGTKRLIKFKKELKSASPHIVFQFLAVAPNEHQIEEVKQLGKELGVDEVLIKSAQIYDYENGNDLIPENDKYSRYVKQKDGTYRMKNSMENRCWRMWQSCVITWDGKVVPCCFDKDASHKMGDLKDRSFRDIWTGNEYKSWRKAVFNSRSDIDICANCTEGTKVWV